MPVLKYIFLILFTFGLVFLSPAVIFAGGGTYSLNISNEQLVPGNQIEIVVTVIDNTRSDPYPLVVNEEFELVAHPESGGERCEMTQKKTDQNGQFKGRCYSDMNGKFAFHIHPISRGDLPDSGSWVVNFQLDESVKQTTPTPSPSPSPTPVATLKPSPKPSTSPKPLVVASPTIIPTAMPKPSLLPTPSPVPTVAASVTPEVKAKPVIGDRTITKTAAGAMILGGATVVGTIFAIWKMRDK